MSNPHTDDSFMYKGMPIGDAMQKAWENRMLDDYEAPKPNSSVETDPLVWRITHQSGPAVGDKSEQEKPLNEMTEWAETNGLYDDYEKDEHLEYELNRESQELEYDFVSLSDDFLSALDGEDKVNNPHHYNTGDIECIDAIKASMSPEAFKGYLKGNTEKYLWRYSYKNGLEDLKKARWYLNYLIQMESE